MSATYVHPSAIVEAPVGDGTRVWAFTHLMEGAEIGSRCNIGSHCFIEAGARIGDDVTIKNGNVIWAGVSLADGVFVGPSVTFTNDRYPRSARLRESAGLRTPARPRPEPTTIEHGATLGAGSTLLSGIRVGTFAFVGAASLVTKDVPGYALVLGNPARPAGWVCACGVPLPFDGDGDVATCRECGSRYRLDAQTQELVPEE